MVPASLLMSRQQRAQGAWESALVAWGSVAVIEDLCDSVCVCACVCTYVFLSIHVSTCVHDHMHRYVYTCRGLNHSSPYFLSQGLSRVSSAAIAWSAILGDILPPLLQHQDSRCNLPCSASHPDAEGQTQALRVAQEAFS